MERRFPVITLRRSLLVLLIFSLVVTSLIATPTFARTQAPIRIGASISLTGEYAAPGLNSQRGYQLCAKHVGEHGGVLGRRLEFVLYDDQSQPATGVRLYEKLITQDKVDLIIGPYSSAITEAVANVTEKYKVPMVAPNATTTSILRRGVAYVPQGHIVFPQMTVSENLEMGAYLMHDRSSMERALERVFGLFPILLERRRQAAGTLSGGEQQMLAIGRALVAEPRLVLLDEPSLGLAPIAFDLIFDKLAELQAVGVTMMIVEQNAAESLRLSNRGYVLELGRICREGPGPALLADPEVKRLYLGG